MKPALKDDWTTIYSVDALTGASLLPEKSVHTIVTSPPYWGLRSYLSSDHPDKAMELGAEKAPEEYVDRLVEVFRALKRVLRDDGTLWLNLGDSFASNGTGRTNDGFNARWNGEFQVGQLKQEGGGRGLKRSVPSGLKTKDLVGIPWLTAFALRADGWYLRSDIVWSKPNPMPESVTDRPTKSHEYMFLLTKRPRYFFDQLAVAESTDLPRRTNSAPLSGPTLRPELDTTLHTDNGATSARGWCDFGASQVSVGSAMTFDTQRFQVVEAIGLDIGVKTSERDYMVGLENTSTTPTAAARIAITLHDLFANRRPVVAPIANGAASPCGAVLASEVYCSPPIGALSRAKIVGLEMAFISSECLAARITLNLDKIQATLFVWGTLRSTDDASLSPDGQNNIISGTRNIRSVWNIATQPYPGAHYATFPPALIYPCIKAGTSERGVCEACGAPWERVVEREPNNDGHPNGPGGKQAKTAPTGLAAHSGTLDTVARWSSRTVGWQPTCSCNGEYIKERYEVSVVNRETGEPETFTRYRSVYVPAIPLSEHPIIPATVLDPFMGSGTTALAARKLGRRSIGLDLDERNIKQIEERLGYQGVMF